MNKPSPPLPHAQYIIPDEDPQCTVKTADDPDDAELGQSGEGLGMEDVGDDDDAEQDEEDPGEEHAASNSDHSVEDRPTRRALPEWLLSEFQARVSESGANHRNAQGLPPLYCEKQSFWFPRPSSFFILERGDLSPQKLYNPRFFLWDPLPLCKVIPCPLCKNPLQRHTHISRPRRCVDADSTFWIIGYRYRCRSCIHPKSKKNTLTFRSWDTRILAALPPALAAEFPARLSHRSGISNATFSWMRSCFQNGMGPKQFSDALRVQHLQHYDELQLQYYHYLCLRRGLDEWRGQKYEAFLPFDDSSSQGPCGFVPSGPWLRDMYDHSIEDHCKAFNQHAAMLSADICAIDHSHKVISSISRSCYCYSNHKLQ